MEVLETRLKPVLLITPHIFEDFRGYFVETYNEELYKKNGISINFVQDNISVSRKNVLRGIHGDPETWKLVYCSRGEIYSVVVDCREESENFGEYESFDLTEKNMHQLVVPPGFGLSYLVLSDWAALNYKQSTYYNPDVLKQFTYKYDDSRFGIKWPINNPILSERDKNG